MRTITVGIIHGLARSCRRVRWSLLIAFFSLMGFAIDAGARGHEAGPNADGIALQDLVLPDRVSVDDEARVRFTVGNQGQIDRWVDVELRINGVRRNVTEFIVDAGSERTHEFGFIVRAGTSSIEILSEGLRLGPEDIMIAVDHFPPPGGETPSPTPTTKTFVPTVAVMPPMDDEVRPTPLFAGLSLLALLLSAYLAGPRDNER